MSIPMSGRISRTVFVYAALLGGSILGCAGATVRTAAAGAATVRGASHHAAATPSSGAPASILPPDAQRWFDIGGDLYKEAYVSGRSSDWDAAIAAFCKAYDAAPNYGPTLCYLAMASELRGLHLTAFAWAKAYLSAAPRGEFQEQAQQGCESASRHAEQQELKIFSAASDLADSLVKMAGVSWTNSFGAPMPYSYQRLQSGHQFYLLDHVRGVRTDIRFVRAQAGDFEAVVEEARESLAECERRPERELIDLMPRFQSPCLNAFLNVCMETADWQGAYEALGWDYGSLAPLSKTSARALRLQSRANDAVSPGATRDAWMAFWDAVAADTTSLGTASAVAGAWARLALRSGPDEKQRPLLNAVEELRAETEQRHGNPESVPVEVADVGVPLGVALHRVHALEGAIDNSLILSVLDANPAHSGLGRANQVLGRTPGLAHLRGYGDLTALHDAALGSNPEPYGYSSAASRREYAESANAGTAILRWLTEVNAMSSTCERWNPGVYEPDHPSCAKDLPTAVGYVAFLLNHGADVNARTTLSWSPLHMASLSQSGEAQARAIVELLLERHADVNACTNADVTPLHLAACTGSASLVKLLLASGARINSTTVDGRTALHMAMRASFAAPGKGEAVWRALLEAGAEVNAKDGNGWTPLHVAAYCGWRKPIKFLVAQGADVNTTTEFQRQTALHLAASEGWLDVVTDLVEAGADVTLADADGRTAAILASDKGHTAVSEYLGNC
jgi:ankyrin repeat protein